MKAALQYIMASVAMVAIVQVKGISQANAAS
jgi:hypothetical protein